MGDFLIRLAGLESTCLLRKVKVDRDVSLVRDKLSLRYECEQRLKSDLN